MTAKYNDSEVLGKLSLGKVTEYASTYDATLLQGVPRSLNRNDLDLGEELPFKGVDLWTGYEVSWLNNKGKPVVAIAEFYVPINSENLIESKSFKLYLNSFNQTRFNDWTSVNETMQSDLSNCAGKPVKVNLFDIKEVEHFQIHALPGENIDDLDIEIESYEFDTSLLKCSPDDIVVTETLNSHLLKSNCLITNQPDWASLVIEYTGRKIDHESMLRYLISFRMHNEFHEQCVERIFTDIMALCSPQELSVYARYTRRGGLDINPFRSNKYDNIPFVTRINRQ
ncbi:NADPH-dependent 7-cyano-7-deazaguanine reductase QueF [Psychrosphaera aestuarii]|uniref:NADPH-dependent 7-cyano-7-deazaguanine reductase QueF n=1 Tax=Psychrosphaera aestuarii TaxID=1266052 RepID=UPI001B345232|nr:NADPH-dependent 7-cyano-7-deazaguanine reductase QueF [Psychrosphaera aestuarii]